MSATRETLWYKNDAFDFSLWCVKITQWCLIVSAALQLHRVREEVAAGARESGPQSLLLVSSQRKMLLSHRGVAQKRAWMIHARSAVRSASSSSVHSCLLYFQWRARRCRPRNGPHLSNQGGHTLVFTQALVFQQRESERGIRLPHCVHKVWGLEWAGTSLEVLK